MIKTENLPGIGQVLADANGFTLYVFEPDSHSTVSCTDACAGSWPPVKVSRGTHPRAGAGVDAKLLGSDPDPAGGQVATYRGWALYGYASDLKPGQANGQALDLNGGPWYVIRPSGDPVIPASQDASGMRMGHSHG